MRRRFPKSPRLFAPVLCLALLLPAGCAEPPANLFLVSQEQIAQRQAESRRYEGIGETDLLAACAGVFQDLGYNLDDSETKLGVITASKQRDATSGAQIAFSIAVALLGGGSSPIDTKQNIRGSLVARPVFDSAGKRLPKTHIVRVTFQRVVTRSDGSTRSETLNDPILYRDFHDRLSKSVFIEAQQL